MIGVLSVRAREACARVQAPVEIWGDPFDFSRRFNGEALEGMVEKTLGKLEESEADRCVVHR